MEKSKLIEEFCMKVEPPVLGQNIVYVVVNGQDIEKIMKQVKLVGLPFVIGVLMSFTVCESFPRQGR